MLEIDGQTLTPLALARVTQGEEFQVPERAWLQCGAGRRRSRP